LVGDAARASSRSGVRGKQKERRAHPDGIAARFRAEAVRADLSSIGGQHECAPAERQENKHRVIQPGSHDLDSRRQLPHGLKRLLSRRAARTWGNSARILDRPLSRDQRRLSKIRQCDELRHDLRAGARSRHVPDYRPLPLAPPRSWCPALPCFESRAAPWICATIGPGGNTFPGRTGGIHRVPAAASRVAMTTRSSTSLTRTRAPTPPGLEKNCPSNPNGNSPPA